MSLERIQIRSKVVDLLKGATDVGSDVFSSRSMRVLEENLPAILVYTKSETVEEHSRAARTYKRDISLVVEIMAKEEDDYDAADIADRIAAQVEEIIDKEDQNANGTLGCLIESAVLVSVDQEWESEGDSAICTNLLNYNVTYLKDAALLKSVSSHEANRIGADWNVGTANDPDPEASDIIELRS